MLECGVAGLRALLLLSQSRIQDPLKSFLSLAVGFGTRHAVYILHFLRRVDRLQMGYGEVECFGHEIWCAQFNLRFLELRFSSARFCTDAHGHDVGGAAHAAHGPEGEAASADSSSTDIEKNSEEGHGHSHGWTVLDDSSIAQITGIFILEFGILLHSVLIGLTLAVDPDFKVLFVVLVFHQMFEGLGLGSRLAYLDLPPQYNYIAIAAAVIYGTTTPIGIAVGLGVRTTYNPGSATASIVSGVMDSLSAGILIYTGLVELLAHEFLFNKEMSTASNKKLTYACVCMLLGAGVMALLGRWA